MDYTKHIGFKGNSKDLIIQIVQAVAESDLSTGDQCMMLQGISNGFRIAASILNDNPNMSKDEVVSFLNRSSDMMDSAMEATLNRIRQ